MKFKALPHSSPQCMSLGGNWHGASAPPSSSLSLFPSHGHGWCRSNYVLLTQLQAFKNFWVLPDRVLESMGFDLTGFGLCLRQSFLFILGYPKLVHDKFVFTTVRRTCARVAATSLIHAQYHQASVLLSASKCFRPRSTCTTADFHSLQLASSPSENATKNLIKTGTATLSC
eukprot:336487-Pelagomonas_calceolata.AAC.3